jgi:hypothetical protein
MPTLRLATSSDLVQVETVVRAAYSGYIPRIGWELGPMLEDYASLIDQGRVHVLASASKDRLTNHPREPAAHPRQPFAHF